MHYWTIIKLSPLYASASTTVKLPSSHSYLDIIYISNISLDQYYLDNDSILNLLLFYKKKKSVCI